MQVRKNMLLYYSDSKVKCNFARVSFAFEKRFSSTKSFFGQWLTNYHTSPTQRYGNILPILGIFPRIFLPEARKIFLIFDSKQSVNQAKFQALLPLAVFDFEIEF